VKELILTSQGQRPDGRFAADRRFGFHENPARKEAPAAFLQQVKFPDLCDMT
jgi:hypothetical protein